jgi:hypothetical protein
MPPAGASGSGMITSVKRETGVSVGLDGTIKRVELIGKSEGVGMPWRPAWTCPERVRDTVATATQPKEPAMAVPRLHMLAVLRLIIVGPMLALALWMFLGPTDTRSTAVDGPVAVGQAVQCGPAIVAGLHRTEESRAYPSSCSRAAGARVEFGFMLLGTAGFFLIVFRFLRFRLLGRIGAPSADEWWLPGGRGMPG